MEKAVMQQRIYEMGLVSTLSHNLARYMAGLSNAYTPDEFLEEAKEVMRERGVDEDKIAEWISAAQEAAQEELVYIAMGQFNQSNGGSAIKVEILIGPILEMMGY